MCGIAGIIGDATQSRLEAMGSAMRHRGPDAEGYWTSPRGDAGFAHRRLAIIDPAGGAQPMADEAGRVVVVLNGAIYNYIELREELEARGHRFRTRSDTETLIYLYKEEGLEFATRLRGMFAIAIWDEDSRRLVIARDRVGKKPLYFREGREEFLFASEIKGLVAGLRGPLERDDQALADYLTLGCVPAPATIYRGVRAVRPGELLVVRDGRVSQTRTFWRLEMSPKVAVSRPEAVERVEAQLKEAVRLRLRSDVPVGVFLSGGVDSGLVTALAAGAGGRRLTTITVGFHDGGFDERPLARLVADRYGTDHQEVMVTPDIVRDLPAIAAAYDQPFADSSAIPSYYVAQAAGRLVKVVLNGDGGDELFAGYRRYVAARCSARLAWMDGAMGRAVWAFLAGVLPRPRIYRSGYAFAHRFIRGLALDHPARYLAWGAEGFADDQKHRLGVRATGAETGGCIQGTALTRRLAQEALGRFDGAGALDRMLGADFVTELPNDLLVKMDIACMAHGLEARSPLLDHELVDVVSRFPEEVKLDGFSTKPILRDLARRYIPEAVTAAPKRGFEVPLVRWLRDDLRSLSEDVILARDGLLAELFDRAALEALLRSRERPDPARWARSVWTLLMLGVWDRHVRVTHGAASVD